MIVWKIALGRAAFRPASRNGGVIGVDTKRGGRSQTEMLCNQIRIASEIGPSGQIVGGRKKIARLRLAP
jgi:hypothetical protein